MRLLFYGLQNSGATLLTMLAGQRPRTVVIPDLWTMHVAPEVPDEADCCLKVTVTDSYPLGRHRERYRPDHTFLVVRRPQDNYVSLRRKPYARHNGSLEDKFAIADRCFGDASTFTDILLFEDVVAHPDTFVNRLASLGWSLPADALSLSRTPLQMERHAWATAPHLYERVQWGVGEARLDPWHEIRLATADDEEADRFARRHAPRLHAWYASRVDSVPTRRIRNTAQDEAALQARRQFAAGQLQLAESLMRSGQDDLAVEVARSTTELIPEDLGAWDVLARALESTDRREDALKVWDQVAGASKSDPDMSALRARQLLRLGELDACEALLEELLDVAEACQDAWLIRADLGLRRRDWTWAADAAERALELAPGSARAWLTLGIAREGQEDWSASADALRHCLALAPGHGVAERKLVEVTVHLDE